MNRPQVFPGSVCTEGHHPQAALGHGQNGWSNPTLDTHCWHHCTSSRSDLCGALPVPSHPSLGFIPAVSKGLDMTQGQKNLPYSAFILPTVPAPDLGDFSGLLWLSSLQNRSLLRLYLEFSWEPASLSHCESMTFCRSRTRDACGPKSSLCPQLE